MESVSMKAATAVLAVTACAFALPAAAQPNMSALYVGGSVGQSHFRQGCTGLVGGVSCDEKDTAWRILAGYQITPTLSAELGYHNFGELKASLGSTSESIKASAWELVAVGLQPLPNRFGIYGKLGAYRAEAKVSSNFGLSGKDTNSALTIGAGLRWDPTPPLGVRLEWQRYNSVGGNSTGGRDDLDVISVGAVWRFR
jgi:OOP family OmpA-OmpF porin